MILKPISNIYFEIKDSTFRNFIAKTGGVISINHSTVEFTSKLSSYYNCIAESYDFYDRSGISGGAMVINGFSTILESNCYDSCQGIDIGSTIYVRCNKGKNSYHLNTLYRNMNGDGPLTSDGVNDAALKDNNISYSKSSVNTALAMTTRSASNSITRNTFSNLESNGFYFWADSDQTYKECNLINFSNTNMPVINVGLSIRFTSCVFQSIPAVLCKKGKNIIITDSQSDCIRYAGDDEIVGLKITEILNPNKVEGYFLCMMTEMQTIQKNNPRMLLVAMFIQFKNIYV